MNLPYLLTQLSDLPAMPGPNRHRRVRTDPPALGDWGRMDAHEQQRVLVRASLVLGAGDDVRRRA